MMSSNPTRVIWRNRLCDLVGKPRGHNTWHGTSPGCVSAFTIALQRIEQTARAGLGSAPAFAGAASLVHAADEEE